jgi:integrase
VPTIRFQSVSRTRILTENELTSIWHRAEEVGYPYGVLIKLLILTGQRRGEIVGLRRSWISKDTITFPVGFCKNKREHVIPLGAMARSIVDGIPNDGELLFRARGQTDTTFSGWSKAKAQFDEPLSIAPYTLHDLRRTYSSQMAALGTPIHVTEKLLNHVSGTLSGVAGVYNRYSYATEMRSAIEAYETRLLALISPPVSNVLLAR